jgi:hypothetical protein
MSYTSAVFSASQTYGLPNIITLTDLHTGVDASVTGRKIYITDAAGNPVVPSGNPSPIFILWPIADATIDLDILQYDMALKIIVTWDNVSNVALYTDTNYYAFTLFSETFYYGLTQQQTSNPNIIQDTNYYNSKMILRCSIDEANNAIQYASDLVSAQGALDRANFLITNQNDFF